MSGVLRVPTATYRLQLRPAFGFASARGILDHLQELGISDLYLSPIFEARRGSEHGYDIVDPTRVRAELGGEAAFRALAAEVRRRDMGILLDIVPNHMAASVENPWWRDVLRHGRASPHAPVFDIDWDRHAGSAAGKLVLPLLDEPLEDAARAGRVRLAEADGERVLRVGDLALPLGPATPPGADLAAALAAQHYRLIDWRDADREINYRRFFAIHDLVGVRVEDPDVFEVTHLLIRRLVEEGLVTGLRVDHVDGLADPQSYLDRLRALGPDLYIVVEKILARGEWLPSDWPVEGTTGYDFLGMTNGLLVDPAGLRAIEEHYARVTGLAADFEEVAYHRQRAYALEHFTGDVAMLARRLAAVMHGGGGPHAGESLTTEALGRAIVELTACLPVYRTYIRGRPLAERDREVLARGFAEARRRAPALDIAFDALEQVVTLAASGAADEALAFVRRWQQLSGAVMAKGVEDTAFYRYNPLISLNEVGCDPGFGAVSAAEFEAWIERRARRWPHTMNATSTHDTKRSEDVRARISSLSHIAARWIERLDRWIAANRGLKRRVDGEPAPSVSREVSLYQVLLGAWPLDSAELGGFRERLAAYLPKAIREAKRRSAWEEPHTEYEEACVAFALRLLEGAEEAEAGWDERLGRVEPATAARLPWLADFLPFQREISARGREASLRLLDLKRRSPGVPDFYQGTEWWSFSLVDPDNRRPVDYKRGGAGLKH